MPKQVLKITQLKKKSFFFTFHFELTRFYCTNLSNTHFTSTYATKSEPMRTGTMLEITQIKYGIYRQLSVMHWSTSDTMLRKVCLQTNNVTYICVNAVLLSMPTSYRFFKDWAIAQAVMSSASHPGLYQEQSIWNLWWAKSHWDVFFSEFFIQSSLSAISHSCSICTHVLSLGAGQWAC